MEGGSSDFGYSLDEANWLYFLSFGPIWYFNIATGQWDLEGPMGLVYVDWPFYYELDTGAYLFVLPPVDGLWVYHFGTGLFEESPRMIPW